MIKTPWGPLNVMGRWSSNIVYRAVSTPSWQKPYGCMDGWVESAISTAPGRVSVVVIHMFSFENNYYDQCSYDHSITENIYLTSIPQ